MAPTDISANISHECEVWDIVGQFSRSKTMKFCVVNGRFDSDKFDSLKAAIVHAERWEHNTIFFVADTEITYLRRNKDLMWEVSEVGDLVTLDIDTRN